MNMYFMKYGKALQVALIALGLICLGWQYLYSMPDMIEPNLGVEIDRIQNEQQHERDREGYERTCEGSNDTRDLDGYCNFIDRDMI